VPYCGAGGPVQHVDPITPSLTLPAAPLNPTLAALHALLIQQALFVLLWLILVYLRVARVAALNWAAGIGLVTAGLTLVVLRGELPRWLGFWGSGVVMYAGFVVLRRGLEVFARIRPDDRRHLLGWLSYSGVLGGVTAWGSTTWFVLVGSVPLGWLLLRAGRAARGPLSQEFGRKAAWFATLPMVSIGVVLIARGLLAPLAAPTAEVPLHSPDAVNLASALVFVACGMVFNLGLCALVATRMMFGLRRASERDHLTGLYNRRTIEAHLARHWTTLQAGGQGLCLMSIDIDHFKAINDAHGHPAGDAVLRRVAEALSEHLGDQGIAGRVGGEEFWFVLPGMRAERAAAVADRLQRSVRALEITVRDSVPVRVTLSMGLADVWQPGEPMDGALQRLDEALYRAKAGGRDRWEWAAPAEPAAEPGKVIPWQASAPSAASRKLPPSDGPLAHAAPARPETPHTTDDCSVV
jgi:diguanylate cyclase (GGDEF)-like protein